MIAAAYALVVVSTLSHAYWNFVLKRANGGVAFVGLSKIVEVVVFAPVFAVVVAGAHTPLPGAARLVVVGAFLSLANYVALSRAYALADLSLVYPVSRAGTLALLPLFGFLAFGERLSSLGAAAVAIIVLGIAFMQLPSLTVEGLGSLARQWRGAGLVFAFLSALATAAYTVWDKRGVQALPAFVYFYAYTCLVASAYGVYLLTRVGASALAAEWRAKRWAIVQVGVLNTATYMAVLIALRTGTSSYVIALRQLSIVWAVVLGWWILGEAVTGPRWLGLVFLLAGCAMVAVG